MIDFGGSDNSEYKKVSVALDIGGDMFVRLIDRLYFKFAIDYFTTRPEFKLESESYKQPVNTLNFTGGLALSL